MLRRPSRRAQGHGPSESQRQRWTRVWPVAGVLGLRIEMWLEPCPYESPLWGVIPLYDVSTGRSFPKMSTGSSATVRECQRPDPCLAMRIDALPIPDGWHPSLTFSAADFSSNRQRSGLSRLVRLDLICVVVGRVGRRHTPSLRLKSVESHFAWTYYCLRVGFEPPGTHNGRGWQFPCAS